MSAPALLADLKGRLQAEQDDTAAAMQDPRTPERIRRALSSLYRARQAVLEVVHEEEAGQ